MTTTADPKIYTLTVENLYTGSTTSTESAANYGEYVRRVKTAHAAGRLNFAHKAPAKRDWKQADLHEDGGRFLLTLHEAFGPATDDAQPSEESLYAE
jgi:hypothetical protein